MEVNRADLHAALTKLKPGLANNEIIDQSTTFVFEDGYISTFNDEITITIPFQTGLTCAVPSKELYQFINRVKVDKLNVTFEEGQFKASGGRVKTGINAHAEISLPVKEIALPADNEWLDLPANFMEGVLMTYESAGRDAASQSMECIHIDGVIMESCDNFRLTVFEMSSEWCCESLIPARNLIQLRSHNPIKYVAAEDWIHFLNAEGAIFSTRPYHDTFEDLDALLDVTGPQVEFPDELKTALGNAEIFVSDENDIRVKIALSKNQIMVKGEGDAGWLEEMVRFKYTGEPVSFMINPLFLRNIIGVLQEVTIGPSCVKFRGTNCSHVISLDA